VSECAASYRSCTTALSLCSYDLARASQCRRRMSPLPDITCVCVAQARGDKIIVFSDNIFALTQYAKALRRPYIYGGTSHSERTRILHAFKHSPKVDEAAVDQVDCTACCALQALGCQRAQMRVTHV
jgi:ERCC3/RAD25/XPB C-terminal helicase